MNTPILFLIFNREDTTRQVFEAIKKQKPKYLYVAADGARKDKPNEAEKCQKVRDIVLKNIEWDCELKTLFRDENLGCKIAVSSALTWFFDNVQQGIILEDDCLPDLSFFPYCEELLERYKDDSRIGCINGTVHHSSKVNMTTSYDFCRSAHIWGWASWRRVWKNYDVNFDFWNKYPKKRNDLFLNLKEKIYFSSWIPDILNGKINTWDMQFDFLLRTQDQLSLSPSVNMVTNLGIGHTNSTNTTDKNKKAVSNLRAMSFPLRHPDYVMSNQSIDSEVRFSWKRLIRYFFRDF
jgi:hypothetical protein